jgi:anti-sigma B factor antagonist
LFAVSVQHEDGPIAIAARGELDIASADELTGTVERACSQSPGVPMVLDLSGLAFCDSTGLRALLSASRVASDGGRDFRITGTNGQVREVIELAGVADALPLAA